MFGVFPKLIKNSTLTKQLLINGDKLNYFDEEKGKKIIARQQLKSSYIRNGVCYVFKKKISIKI